jgi:hypothetical protein
VPSQALETTLPACKYLPLKILRLSGELQAFAIPGGFSATTHLFSGS